MTIHVPISTSKRNVPIGRKQRFDRVEDWSTGFQRPDPFFGELTHPQSFHKYAYVHGDPVNGIDPTGKFFTIAGLVTAFAISRSANTTYNNAVVKGGSIAAGLLLDIAAFSLWRLTYLDSNDLTLNYGTQRDQTLNHTFHSMKLQFPAGTDMNAALDRIYADLRDFTYFDESGVGTNHNYVATVDLLEEEGVRYAFFDTSNFLPFGGGSDFINPRKAPVRLSSDISDRRVYGDTLGWHMLVGQRQWWVEHVGGTTVEIKTEAYEFNRDPVNELGQWGLGFANYDIQNDVWSGYLKNIRDAYVTTAGVTVVEDVNHIPVEHFQGQPNPWLPRDPYPGIETP